MVSYLGYLLGKNENEKARYIIISQDTDYDNVIKFWKGRTGFDIKRQSSMGAKGNKSAPKALLAKTVNTVNTVNSVNKAGKSSVKAKTSQKKVQLNNEIQKKLSQAGFDKEIIGYVASLCIKQFSEKNAKQNIYRDIVAKYGQKQGLEIYNKIKQNI